MPTFEEIFEKDHSATTETAQQVVLNLLSNAVKFTPEGGTVLVTANITKEPYYGSECMLEIAV